jgi:PAS domain S-box-containing protein
MTQAADELRLAWFQLKAHVDRLARERQHYLDFFEQAGEPYLVTDRDARIVEVNGAAVDLFARRRRHLRGKPLAALIAPECRRDFRTRLRALPVGDWTTRLTVAGRRRDVTVKARRAPSGICWLLRALQ